MAVVADDGVIPLAIQVIVLGGVSGGDWEYLGWAWEGEVGWGWEGEFLTGCLVEKDNIKRLNMDTWRFELEI